MLIFFMVTQFLNNNGSNPAEYCDAYDAHVDANPSEGLDVTFSTVFSGAGYRTYHPNDNDVAMGTWIVESRTGSDILIETFTVETLSADTGAYDWEYGGGLIDVQDHVMWCYLVEDISGTVLGGPQAPIGTWRLIDFAPNIVVGSSGVRFTLYCDFSSEDPAETYDLFAVDTSPTLIQAENDVGDSVDVTVFQNSDPSTGVATPKFAIRLDG